MKILEVELNGELRLNLNTVLFFIIFILRTIMTQINVHIDIQFQKKKSFIMLFIMACITTAHIFTGSGMIEVIFAKV